ncbi:MAG: SURF1 family protein [Alphaproteobacteria bacterium]|jgi:cytochrome oxidase assembly protein ShyY1|nr:SURF1 family protein [Alphaproteobacteria bacterium]MBT5390713.1 SURF1 family protein [Alphaproteobacteria bacterium]MBT5654677.1 SURF1 family protein [Alphaproteobacteria bacterium]
MNIYFKPLLWPTLICLVFFSFFIGLGTWQLKRLQWKEALIESREETLRSPPMHPKELDDIRQESAHKRPLQLKNKRLYLKGRLLNAPIYLLARPFQINKNYGKRTADSLDSEKSKSPTNEKAAKNLDSKSAKSINDNKPVEQLDGGRPALLKMSEERGSPPKGTVGKHLIMPLQLEDGRVILLNLGWVPRDFEDTSVLVANEYEGIAHIAYSEKPGHFVPDNMPNKNQWHWIEQNRISEAQNVPFSFPFYGEIALELIERKGNMPIPQGGASQLANNHLVYAVTWYSMALVLVVMWAVYHRSRRRLRLN